MSRLQQRAKRLWDDMTEQRVSPWVPGNSTRFGLSSARGSRHQNSLWSQSGVRLRSHREIGGFRRAAADHPEFARELPRFVSEVRECSRQMRLDTHRARRGQHEKDANAAEDDDDKLFRESPATVAEQARQFAIITELLTAPELGTS